MKRNALRVTRALVALSSAAVLALSAAGSVTAESDVVISPGVPAAGYWPAPDDDAGCPPRRLSRCDYILTDAYWSWFRDCLAEADHDLCWRTVHAQYRVIRVH